jgi:hypothetical protein
VVMGICEEGGYGRYEVHGLRITMFTAGWHGRGGMHGMVSMVYLACLGFKGMLHSIAWRSIAWALKNICIFLKDVRIHRQGVLHKHEAGNSTKSTSYIYYLPCFTILTYARTLVAPAEE